MFNFLATKRFWKRLVIAVGAVVLLLVVVAVSLVWWIDRQWESRVAAIRAAGYPASVADLAPEPIPDDQNAAAVLERVAPQLKAFSEDQWAFWDLPIGKQLDEAEQRGEPPSPEQVEAIRQILAKYPEIDEALTEAVAKDRYASRLNYSLGPLELIDENIERAPSIRILARFQAWQMLVLTADGHVDQAVARGIDVLKLAQLHDSEPFLVNYLVGTAVREAAIDPLYDAIATGDVSPEQHNALDAEISRHDDRHRLLKAMQSERAFVINTVLHDNLFEEEVSDIGDPLGFSTVMKWEGLGVIDAMNEQVGIADQPWYELYADRESSHTDTTGHGVLADLMAPPIEAVQTADARATARLRALRVFNALARFADENGREATGLEELELPPEATIDPFSGEPLKLKHIDKGWIVYSVDEDGVDDDGDFNDQKDRGVAPRGHRGD